MTAPSFPSSGGVVQVGGGGFNMQEMLPVILQMLAQSRARKDNQAQTALGAIPPGATYGSLTPDLQRAYARATGRKPGANDVVSPITNPQQVFTNTLQGILARDPAMAQNLATTFGIHMATGRDQPLMTPGAANDMTSANVASAANTRTLTEGARSAMAKIAANQPLTEADVLAMSTVLPSGATPGETMGREAAGRATQRVAPGLADRQVADNSLKTQLTTEAQGALQATRDGRTPTNAQLMGSQAILELVPSEPISRQLTADARTQVIRQAAGFLADPNNSSLRTIFREMGMTVTDAMGAAVAGIGSFLDQGLSRRNIIINNAGQAQNIAEKAAFDVAEQISERMNGRFSPQEIRRVMQFGVGRDTGPQGNRDRAISSFLQAGFDSALMTNTIAADPAMQLFKTMQEVARNPRIAGNDQLMEGLNRSAMSIISSSLADRIFDQLPTESRDPGVRDQLRREFTQQIIRTFGGVLREDRSWFNMVTPGSDLRVEQPAPAALPPMDDAALNRLGQVLSQTLKNSATPPSQADLHPTIRPPGNRQVP